ncbi:MAG: HAMP domain-containing histidine kinase [Elusimicrobia bacterium]|mgnify:CR=1 FL=1|jgi:two-component system sensor histidine kinase BaeS|nr:HAMP domain-containing histidine kinase [Elusimicrobiota bacterium]
MKLRARLSLFTGVIIVALVAGISVSTLVLLRKVFLAEVRSNQETTLNSFSQTCEESLVLRDPVLVANYVDSLRKSLPGLAYAVFVNQELGRTIGDTAQFRQIYPYFSHAVEPGLPRRLIQIPRGEVIVEVSTEIRREGQSAGMVRMGFYQSYVQATIADKVGRVQQIVLVVAGVSLILAVMATLLMSAQITRPLHQLAAGAKAIGEGNLDTQIYVSRRDELGFLAHEFNIMAVRLKELDQLKDEFVSSVSHELRSPLAAISGYVELMTRKPLEQIPIEKRTKAFNIILDSTTRLTQFINDILDLAKLKAGRVDIRKTPFSVAKALDETMSLFAPLLEKKNITSRVLAAENLPALPADDEKMRQVITNLVSNAYKFTPEGGVLTLDAKDTGVEITVSVSDTGIGIPKEFIEHLFERFKQVPGTRQKMGGPKGTGLGLAIAKGIVEAHGGRIWAESEPGQGTTFFFTLPKVAPAHAVADARIFN